MKRIFSIVAGLALAAFVAAPAMAFQLVEGEFAVGIVGSNDEMVIDMQTALTDHEVINLFDINDIGGTFTGDSALSQLRIGGAGYIYEQAGRDYNNLAWVAVEQGATTEFNYTSLATMRSPLQTIENTYTDTTAGDFVVNTASSTSMAGLLDGVYSGILDDAIGTITLADLTASNPIIMDIWMFDNQATNVTTDDTFEKTLYTLTLGIDGDMVYAQVSQVPVPGALILLGSGLLALVGVRRKNA